MHGRTGALARLIHRAKPSGDRCGDSAGDNAGDDDSERGAERARHQCLPRPPAQPDGLGTGDGTTYRVAAAQPRPDDPRRTDRCPA